MAHFGSGAWVGNFGPIPYNSSGVANVSTGQPQGLNKSTVVMINTSASTFQGTTEGTDLATFTLPDAGMYRIFVYIAVNVASDAGTETVAPVITYTDSVGAKTNVALMTGATQATVNAKTAGAAGSWMGAIRGLAGGSLAVKLQNVIGTSVRTVGSVNWSVCVEKISD